MKISYFETGRYIPPADIPREWPVYSGACDPATVSHALRGMAERGRFVAELGFDWISPSENFTLPKPILFIRASER